LILRDENSDPASDDQCDNGRIFYLADANFNVTAIVAESSRGEEDWAVRERYVYTPYGAATILDADFAPVPGNTSAYATTTLYTGRRVDAETGLYYYRARYYHAQLGRFINRDPIGYGAGDSNLYRYVGNRVTSATDPFGLFLPKFSFASGEKIMKDLEDSKADKAELEQRLNQGIRQHFGAEAGSGDKPYSGWVMGNPTGTQIALPESPEPGVPLGEKLHGLSGFIIFYDIGQSSVTQGANGKLCCDWSQATLAFKAWYWVNRDKQEQEMVTTHVGLEMLEFKGPSSTEEHERWHTDGTPGKGATITRIVQKQTLEGPMSFKLQIQGFPGYTGAAAARQQAAEQDLRSLRVVPEGEHPERYCDRVLWEVFSSRFLDRFVRYDISAGGHFHSGALGSEIWAGDIKGEKITPALQFPRFD
ncbi:MAG TPA: RHS repeat-associated core domain-containing protein, partial [Thermoguttaceae bacterium]|nr:RHS repeat-associated core domain-containing protein [Thermoguttaceae bacterium]